MLGAFCESHLILLKHRRDELKRSPRECGITKHRVNIREPETYESAYAGDEAPKYASGQGGGA